MITLLDRSSDKICIFGMKFKAIASFELFSPNSLYVGFSRGSYTAQWLVQPFSSFPFLPISSMPKFSSSSLPSAAWLVCSKKSASSLRSTTSKSPSRTRCTKALSGSFTPSSSASLEVRSGLSSLGCGASFLKCFLFPSDNYLYIFSSGIQSTLLG